MEPFTFEGGNICNISTAGVNPGAQILPSMPVGACHSYFDESARNLIKSAAIREIVALLLAFRTALIFSAILLMRCCDLLTGNDKIKSIFPLK